MVKKVKKAPAKKAEGGLIDREKYNYGSVEFMDGDGKKRKSVSNGDAIAKAMAGLDQDGVVSVIKENGLGDKLSKHIGKINPGQLRMLTGNSLRAMVRRGEKVVVDGKKITSLEQPVALKKGKR